MSITQESNLLKRTARETISFRFDLNERIARENDWPDKKRDDFHDLSICVELAAIALSTSDPNQWIDRISKMAKDCAVALKADYEESEKND